MHTPQVVHPRIGLPVSLHSLGSDVLLNAISTQSLHVKHRWLQARTVILGSCDTDSRRGVTTLPTRAYRISHIDGRVICLAGGWECRVDEDVLVIHDGEPAILISVRRAIMEKKRTSLAGGWRVHRKSHRSEAFRGLDDSRLPCSPTPTRTYINEATTKYHDSFSPSPPSIRI